MRMLSPAAFLNGPTTDPFTANLCDKSWGPVITSEVHPNISCIGIANVSGTGPFQLATDLEDRNSRTSSSNHVDDEVVFVANPSHWDGPPAFDSLKVVRYDTSEEIKAALLAEELDVVWGAGVLPDTNLLELCDGEELQGKLNVFYLEDIQNVLILLNSGKPPLDDIEVRKIIIHAINKGVIVEKEQLGDTVDNVFPRHIHFCDIDLTPHWDYDLEKAVLLSCPNTCGNTLGNTGGDDDDTTALAVRPGVGLGIPLVVLVCLLIYYFNKTKQYEAEMVKKSDVQEA